MIKNQLKTVILLGVLTALSLWVGKYFGGTLGLTIAFLFVMLMNVSIYWFSDKIVLRMYKTKEVPKSDKLYGMVKEVAGKAGIPMPKVCMMPSNNPNAFATGRNPEHAAVVLSQGIMNLLDEDELKAVIAHEVAHIKNRDTLIITIASTIAGVIAYLASMARWAAIFGGFGDDKDNGLELLFLAILTPLIATIIQLSISRSREFLADETGAKTIRNPNALADALLKIDSGIKRNPLRFGNRATSSLFIANPFRGRAILNLFSTHPPIEKRVEILRSMKSR